MSVKNPAIERTPTTFILRDVQLAQGVWFAFGLPWLIVVLSGLGFAASSLAVIAIGFLVSGNHPGLLHELAAGLGMLTLFTLPFFAAGAWMLWMALRVEHTEAHIWTFDKINRVFAISKQTRNRKTHVAQMRLVGTYPLPAPGATRVRSLAADSNQDAELMVNVTGHKIRGMRGKFRRWHLTQVVRELDDFLGI